MKKEIQKKISLENNLTKIIAFKSFGVNAIFQTNDEKFYDLTIKKLPLGWKEIDSSSDIKIVFSMVCGENNQFYIDEKLVSEGPSLESFIDYVEKEIRITIGGISPEYIFLHSSVVGIEGEAVLFPATSFSGKTTLAKEFVRLGADYFSDEYAIIDKNGLVYPYPKPLSVRGIIDENTQTDITVEDLGGKKATQPIPIKFICLTEYKLDGLWQPQILSNGMGILELLKHTLSTRENPKFTLKVLNLIAKRAIIAKSERGDVSEFAKIVLYYLKSI
jgi:hypothetical protein